MWINIKVGIRIDIITLKKVVIKSRLFENKEMTVMSQAMK